jgi:NAD(P)-dependent dehydrogenase (short-subunit alcohol dehydrogenase family)
MYTRRLNLRDPKWEEREYDGVVAYAETKRAQVVLAELWAEELRGSAVVVNAMHPGRGSRHRRVAGGLLAGEAVDPLLLLRSRDPPDTLPALHEGVR